MTRRLKLIHGHILEGNCFLARLDLEDSIDHVERISMREFSQDLLEVHDFLKERDYLKHAFGDSHDDENANEGTDHQEKRPLMPPFFHKETDNACRKDSKTSNWKGREKDKPHISQRHHLLQKGPLFDTGHDPIGLSGEPPHGKEFLTRMFQNGSIDRDLYVVINQSQGKVESNRHLVEDSEENRKGTTQREMNESEEEDQVSLTRYGFHSTPMKIDEKQSSGEIPRWRTVRIFRSIFWLMI